MSPAPSLWCYRHDTRTMIKKLIANFPTKAPPKHDNAAPQSAPPQTLDVIPQEEPSAAVDHESMAPVEELEPDRVPTPPQETKEDKLETLGEGQLRTLFA